MKRIKTWLNGLRISPKIVFLVTGVISAIWFLIRVIPKPSRAGYPCMRVAAPFMSGLVIYLLSLGGLVLSFKKAVSNLCNAK